MKEDSDEAKYLLKFFLYTTPFLSVLCDIQEQSRTKIEFTGKIEK